MPYKVYKYQMRRDVAMIDDMEWEILRPHYEMAYKDIIATWKQRGSHLKKAFGEFDEAKQVMDMFQLITDEKLDSMLEIQQRRISQLGRPCPACGIPFRTPKAKLCVSCGKELPEGEIAGQLSPDHLQDQKYTPSNSILGLDERRPAP